MAAAVIGAAYIILVLRGQASHHVAATVSRVGFPAMEMLYPILGGLAARAAQGRFRVALLVLTAGLSCTLLGDLLWAYYQHTRGEVPFPGWTDLAYLSYVPLVTLAMLLIPSGRSWQDQGRLVLDGLIVTGSFFLVSWITGMRNAWHSVDMNRLEFAVTLAYPAGDVLIVTVGLLVLTRVPAGLHPMMGLLVGGLTLSAAGNAVWAYNGDPSQYKVGSIGDIFFATSILLIVVALVAARGAQPGATAATPAQGSVTLWLPLLPVAVAAVVAATAKAEVVAEPPVLITGAVVVFATLFRQYTQAAELVGREQRIRTLADRLTAEMASAAKYVDSILPIDMNGPVTVVSRYRPATAVGGDSFGHYWVDDDHLVVYLIDVSGHGVKSALLSVSIHNLLRGPAPGDAATRLEPAQVLAELNSRFSMEGNDGHYFTIWYGVYQRSTGLLRYANAGHPLPLVLTSNGGGVRATPLAGLSMPAGMFDDTEFETHSYTVTPGTRILLYSDGALNDPPRTAEFTELCTQGPSLGWVDWLIPRLPGYVDGHFEDDCSLVELTFNA